MKKLKNAALIIALLFATTTSFAHALWIETNANGNKGKSQEINVYFGEFADNDITPAAKWFSDLKDFSLIAISPSKKEIKLESKMLDNKYQAIFTPEEEGVYTIVMHHLVKDVYGTMKLDYNSSTTVAVGKAVTGNVAENNNNEISVFNSNPTSLKKDSPVTLVARYKNQIAKSQKIKVIAPNGWEKELWSNDKGEVTFTPIWSGNYMAEFAITEKEAGEHNGKKFDEVWKMATYKLIVK
ncbi:hypothetical protein [Flavobacterium agrisoli]|uniref:GH25 family protein n=1 Tax=Flavobacterium agrisoli TaxID=2793066 RepID=A0A934PL23_9FLAO|nr:hypothetical protein [Flavobacterium agrisoli]MBK0368888.1 hypothetical protein [Flavobacterium agrisoli]